ncbi:MAG: hypothetical protein ACOCUP_03055 [bacterium]
MGYYRRNIDKGGQSQGGSDMLVQGDFSNDTNQKVYTPKTVTHSQSFEFITNNAGEVWLIVGYDSGFEATTTIYYNEIAALFKNMNNNLLRNLHKNPHSFFFHSTKPA